VESGKSNTIFCDLIFNRYIDEASGSFSPKSLASGFASSPEGFQAGGESGMDDLFFNRMIAEWLKDR